FFVSSSGLTNSMPMPGSSTPGPAGLYQATLPVSLHSGTPGSCRSTCTSVPLGGAPFEFTNTPPMERLVPQPLYDSCAEVTPTMNSWCTRGLLRVGEPGFTASMASLYLHLPQLGRNAQLRL